jgi:uncharacterized protein
MPMSLKYFILRSIVITMVAVMPLAACYAQPPKMETETVIITSAGRDKAKLQIEVAIDPRTQERGLMNRTAMAKDAGMIFVFPDNVDIHHMAKPLDETPIYSRFPCRAVIELNGGRAKALKLEIGDLVLSDALDRAVEHGTGASE